MMGRSNGRQYFSHDHHARNDEKILILRAECGWEGYGIYWALVEMLHETPNSQIRHADITRLSRGYNIVITVLQRVVDVAVEEGLFTSDGEVFWSESVRRRKVEREEVRKRYSDAGRKGMESRWQSHSDNDVITMDNKERKGKEKKLKIKDTPPILRRPPQGARGVFLSSRLWSR